MRTLLRNGALPGPIVRGVLRARAGLTRLAGSILPPQVVLLDELAGVARTVALHIVAKHRIADLVAEAPRTKGELAAATGLSADLLERVLSALVSCDVFSIDAEGRYANTRVSEVLRSGVQGSLRSMAEYYGAPMNLAVWAALEGSLRGGAPAFDEVHGRTIWEHFAKDEAMGKLFAAAMGELTAIDAPTVAAGYPFGRFARICDVAGGRGQLLATILARHPEPRGVLFDEAHVLVEAEPFLREANVADRVERVAGSFFERVPEGCDAYLLKDILHDWDDERCVAILKVVRAAMAPGARLLACEVPIDHRNPTFPAPIADLQMMVNTSGGKQRTTAELGALFAASGLALEAVHDLALPVKIVEARPAA